MSYQHVRPLCWKKCRGTLGWVCRDAGYKLERANVQGINRYFAIAEAA
jgi:hypothetical protein